MGSREGLAEVLTDRVPLLADCEWLRDVQAVGVLLRVMEGLRERLPVALLEGLLVPVRVPVGLPELLLLGEVLGVTECDPVGEAADELLTEGELEPEGLTDTDRVSVGVVLGEEVEDLQRVGVALGHADGLLLRVPEEHPERDLDGLPEEDGQRELVPDLQAEAQEVALRLGESAALTEALVLGEGEAEADGHWEADPEAEVS